MYTREFTDARFGESILKHRVLLYRLPVRVVSPICLRSLIALAQSTDATQSVNVCCGLEVEGKQSSYVNVLVSTCCCA